jgi:hypothetical protein
MLTYADDFINVFMQEPERAGAGGEEGRGAGEGGGEGRNAGVC